MLHLLLLTLSARGPSLDVRISDARMLTSKNGPHTEKKYIMAVDKTHSIGILPMCMLTWSHAKLHTRCIDEASRNNRRSIAEISPNIR